MYGFAPGNGRLDVVVKNGRNTALDAEFGGLDSMIPPAPDGQAASRKPRITKVTPPRLLGGFPQQNRAQPVVGAVSHQALDAAASLMLKALFPQATVLADGAEVRDGEIAQHGDPAEFQGTCRRIVGMELAIGDSLESGAARHGKREREKRNKEGGKEKEKKKGKEKRK